ncbi:transcription elongation factor Spt5 [Candidatus Woesearchaeota archaeon]|nr:transcription elongation factor Spt5 [Candidatus Woesearchaeota archaeon]
MEDRLIGEEELKRLEEEKKQEEQEIKEEDRGEEPTTKIYAVRTTAGREDQVAEFIARKVEREKIKVYSILRPHGMKSYIFLEAENLGEVEQAISGVPYARGVLRKEIPYKEIEPHVEQGKREINIKKNDIAEIISGPFKGEQCKVTRVDKAKGEVVVQLLESAVPIPITVSIDSIKVIRREE